MQDQISTGLSKRLQERFSKRHEVYLRDPRLLYPWILRPCRVRVLLVTDGGLDFSDRDFGLSTFVDILQNDGRPYVRFDITLAHLSEIVSDDAVMTGAVGIVRSIKGFRFDDPTHFTPTMYDQVWLFGIETDFHRGNYQFRANNSALYPADRLANAELQNLSAFMNQGGGLFATGDHGALGRSLCGSVNRVRSMRLWSSTSANNNLDEVSMGGERRNDTNRIGHDAGSQFDDQSDDVPQIIQPKLYRRRISFIQNAIWPHPLLCGPNGMINVMPDHPHEGECVAPTVLNTIYPYDGSEEFPNASAGGGRIAPEIIATASVPAGNNANGTKNPTIAHNFGSICAYDGHLANVGRVVTDATWHHFVNVNLVGVSSYSNATIKGQGFLASAQGLAYLDMIKNYYVNIAVWISPATKHGCFHRYLLWDMVYQHRVMEAVLAYPDLKLSSATASLLYEIGIHARDVLGRVANQCQSYSLIYELVAPIIPEFVLELDPWGPMSKQKTVQPLPWVDPSFLLYTALGGAITALREAFPYPSPDMAEKAEKRADAVIRKGAVRGVAVGLKSMESSIRAYGRKVQPCIRQVDKMLKED